MNEREPNTTCESRLDADLRKPITKYNKDWGELRRNLNTDGMKR